MKLLEQSLWIAGILCLGVYGVHVALAENGRSDDVLAYKTAIANGLLPADNDFSNPQQELWSEGRKAAFEQSLTEATSDVLGILEIPRLELEVPVYDGATDLHMDRGAARIEGTARPGEPGNLGVAGHRDGFFRVLKDIELGDQITITNEDGAHTYTVLELLIVDPSAVEVLDPTPQQSVTLVTCYPFYFVGHAPERFIVRAVRREFSTVSKI